MKAKSVNQICQSINQPIQIKMKCKIAVLLLIALIVCGLFQMNEASKKKKFLKKAFKGALIAAALKPSHKIIPLPVPIPFPIHTHHHHTSWSQPMYMS